MENIGHFKHDGKTCRIDIHRLHERQGWLNLLFLNHAQARGCEVGITPMVSLMTNEGGLKLGGLYLPESDRGGILSKVLLEIGFRVTESAGLSLRHTAKIRKPLVALLLCKYGFEPDSTDTLAEILPKDGCLSQKPIVRISTNRTNLRDLRPEWCEVIPGEADLSSGNPVVGLYTTYSLTDPSKASAMRETTITSMDGLLRVFTNRVKKHLMLPY